MGVRGFCSLFSPASSVREELEVPDERMLADEVFLDFPVEYVVDTDELLGVLANLLTARLSCCCTNEFSLDLSVEGMLDTDESLCILAVLLTARLCRGELGSSTSLSSKGRSISLLSQRPFPLLGFVFLAIAEEKMIGGITGMAVCGDWSLEPMF